MDIQAANTPAKAKAAASDKQDKSKVEDGREGAPAFAQLLQGLQPPAALEARVVGAEAAEVRELPAAELLQADNGLLPEGLSAVLDLGSLVTQTALLDDRADAALQNGSFVLAVNKHAKRENLLYSTQEELEQVIKKARQAGISKAELADLIAMILEEE